jgi:hypothetical protein
MKTIDFIKSLEASSGGITAWEGYNQSYPEVSGYLIPTLIVYGETELAHRVADWLEQIQNADGSFSSMDALPHSFDTAAIVEGLQATGRTEAANRALAWLDSMLRDDGLLRIHSNTLDTHARDFRSLAIMGRNLDDVPEPLVAGLLEHAQRNHYLLYALEGMLNMGYEKRVRAYLQKIYVNSSGLVPNTPEGYGTDTTATAQAACLLLRLGEPANEFVNAVRAVVNDDGSLPHDKTDTRKIAWAAKYACDMENYIVRTTILPEASVRERPEAPKNVRAGNKKTAKQVS